MYEWNWSRYFRGLARVFIVGCDGCMWYVHNVALGTYRLSMRFA